MFYYYIKIAIKNLWNNKKYSAINIAGFSFALSIFLAIILFVMFEKSYDKYHTNGEHIYRLIDEGDNSSSIDYRVKDILINQFSDVKNACLYQQASLDVSLTSGGLGYSLKNIASVDKAYFEMFDIKLVKGNKERPFDNLNSVVITESAANYLFGDEDPMGKELILSWKSASIFVTGVIEDFPANSSMEASMIVNAENDDFKFSNYIGNGDDLSTYRWPFRIYLQLNEHSDETSLLASINGNIDFLKPYVGKAGLLHLHDMYLFDTTSGSSTKKGNPALILLLIGIAFIILILAVINYINLALAQQQKRGKEIGVRKTIGATRKNLILQFLSESVIMSVIAFGISLILFEIMSPLFTGIFNIRLSIGTMFHFPNNILVLVSVLMIGVLTGLWPALSFSSFNPISVFNKRTVSSGRRNYSRNGLTIFQFTVSIALIFCVVVIWKQIEYSKHADLGFDKDQLLCIDLPPSDGSSDKVNVLRNRLLDYTHISNLTASNGVPGEIRLHMGAAVEGKDKSLAIIGTDSSFLKTFNIKVAKGRGFLPGDVNKACLLNQAAIDYLEWEDITNKRYNNGREGGYEVVGVVEDFHIGSLHSAIEPTAILYNDRWFAFLSLRIEGGNIGPTMDFIKKSWKETLPEYPLTYKFYDDWFNIMYQKEERLGKVISFFAILAISISCIGILGLAIFTTERRTKEIGIRKVNGASVENIFALMTREFTVLVFVAFVIAAPLAFMFMRSWLEAFAYRTEISWWIFVISGFSAMLIAWLTVGWQSLKAALTNPVEALRYE
jgi:putative ABC transport system permease protein